MKPIVLPASMRLADFIEANVEPILAEWDAFARTVWPAGIEATRLALRNHSKHMLMAVVQDMRSYQSDSQQADKSKGQGNHGTSSKGMDRASDIHAISRVETGFDLRALVAEYRALRASVIHLWVQNVPEQGPRQLQDMIRFNEAIDQLLAKSVLTYAERMDQSREIFLAILCHDLRNPLQAVTMLANLLAESKSLDEKSHTMATHMASSVAAMDEMISDLLDFTGTRLGARMAVTPTAMDLEALCREVLHEMEAIHSDRTFVFESKGNLTGTWDAARLRQLISNLLRNAVQHGSPATPIDLSVFADPKEITIVVNNYGVPIPSAALESIFEPMTQHHATPSSNQEGSVGLGLYIVREVANAHGGTVEVHSEEEQTRFIIKFPRLLSRHQK